jgi:hypothetical protein
VKRLCIKISSASHEAIISRETFETVKKIRAELPERQSVGAYSPHLFKGKVLCAKCGHIMHRHRQNKDGTYWFRCETQWKFSKNLCTVVSVRESDLKSEIIAIVHKYSEIVHGKFIELNAQTADKSGDIELNEINIQLNKSGQFLKSLYESLVSGLINADEFKQMKSDYEMKIAELSEKSDEIRNQKREAETRKNEYQSLENAVVSVLSNEILTADIIDKFVDKILVNPDKSFEVQFKFADIFGGVVKDLSRKIKSAKYEKMRRGEFVSKNCIFGYKLNDKRQMIIDESAAETVRLIFKLALKKKSLSEIAKRLYEEKRPTIAEYKQKKENPSCVWGVGVISQILNNEQYTGIYIAGRKKIAEVGSKIQVKLPESEWVKIPNHHAAIISKEIFENVREIINTKITISRKRKIGTWQRYRIPDSPLKGKVICGICNHSMQMSATQNSRFCCKFTRSAVESECYKSSVNAAELEVAVFEIITKQAQVILNIDNFSEISNINLQSEKQAEYDKIIEKLQNDKRTLYEKFVLGEINAEDYKTTKSEVDIEIERLNSIKSASNEKIKVYENTAEKKKLAEIVNSEISLTKSLADLLIEKIRVFPDNRIEIDWKIADFCKVGND